MLKEIKTNDLEVKGKVDSLDKEQMKKKKKNQMKKSKLENIMTEILKFTRWALQCN